MVRILHAPMHSGSRKMEQSLKLVNEINAASVEMTEMHRPRSQQLMHKVLKPNYLTHQEQPHNNPFERDVSIALKNRYYIDGDGQNVIQSSFKQPGIRGIGNPRFQRERMWEYKGQKFAHIGIHWNAVIQDKRTGAVLENDRAQAMARAGSQLERSIRRFEEIGAITFVSGDPNWREHLPKSYDWEYSPCRILKENDMKFRWVGLDVLAWPKDTFKNVDTQVISKTANLQDHPWILGTFIL